MTEQGCDTPESRQFDFWVGQWNLFWPAEQTGGPVGATASGSNRVEKLFGHCAVEENFATDDGSFVGRSLSVYNHQDGKWQQTWVDNMGSYLLVTGKFDGTRMELRTEKTERDDETVLNRMIFRDIFHDSLLWEWQGSRDGGVTWNNLWTITYQRRG